MPELSEAVDRRNKLVRGDAVKYILGLDIGTTGCKANVFNESGKVCVKSYHEYLDKQHAGVINPEIIWREVYSAIKECICKYPDIEAICTTSFGESVVAVDADGNSLGDTVLYTSAHAVREWKLLEERVGKERIAEITGHISHPMYTINHLMWLKKNNAKVYEKADKFLFFASYIERKLGAVCCAENTLAARSMAYDVRNEVWSQEICEKAEIDVRKFPRVVKAGDKIGYVTEELANEFGMSKSPVILAGGHDQPCVALGLGAILPGDAAYGMGTVECLTLVLDKFCQSSEMQKSHLICTPHVIEGKFVTYGVLFSGGSVISDLRNKLYSKEAEETKHKKTDIYETMMNEMPDGESQVFYVPHLAGTGTPQMDTNDRGLIYGLTLNTKRGELVKAALEGIAFDMKQNITNMESCQLPVGRILAAGGGAKSEKGLQVRCDIIQRRIFVADDIQAGVRGVFYIAARALGWIDNYEDGIPKLAGKWIEPNGSEKIVQKNYERYMKLYNRTRGI